MITCPTCDGRGKVWHEGAVAQFFERCDDCKGTGSAMSELLTGATKAQIEAAAKRKEAIQQERFAQSFNLAGEDYTVRAWTDLSEESRAQYIDNMRRYAEGLVKPTARIVEDWDATAAALRPIVALAKAMHAQRVNRPDLQAEMGCTPDEIADAERGLECDVEDAMADVREEHIYRLAALLDAEGGERE